MRWLWGALAVGALSLSGCGSSGAGASSFGTPDDSGTVVTYDATAVNLIPDATTSNDSGLACTPRTCAQAGANCGPVADGCGGLLACGVCGTGQSCGGGGTPSVCGGAVTCTPKTCADPSVATLCGQQADGCGGLIPVSCVTCTGTTTCGGGNPGTPNVCGGTAACIPTTATAACIVPGTTKPMNCGVMADGCGGLVPCGADDGGSCPTGEECGGSGTPNVCGAANVTTLSDGAVVFDRRRREPLRAAHDDRSLHDDRRREPLRPREQRVREGQSPARPPAPRATRAAAAVFRRCAVIRRVSSSRRPRRARTPRGGRTAVP